MTNGDIVKIKVNQDIKLVGTLNDDIKLNMKKDIEYQITFIGCYNDKLMFKFNDNSFALKLKYLKNMKKVHDLLPYYHANICDKFNYKY